MINPDEDLPKPAANLRSPLALETLGVAELQAYIGVLQAEIARVQAQIAAKAAHKSAAAAFFKTADRES